MTIYKLNKKELGHDLAGACDQSVFALLMLT